MKEFSRYFSFVLLSGLFLVVLGCANSPSSQASSPNGSTDSTVQGSSSLSGSQGPSSSSSSGNSASGTSSSSVSAGNSSSSANASGGGFNLNPPSWVNGVFIKTAFGANGDTPLNQFIIVDNNNIWDTGASNVAGAGVFFPAATSTNFIVSWTYQPSVTKYTDSIQFCIDGSNKIREYRYQTYTTTYNYLAGMVKCDSVTPYFPNVTLNSTSSPNIPAWLLGKWGYGGVYYIVFTPTKITNNNALFIYPNGANTMKEAYGSSPANYYAAEYNYSGVVVTESTIYVQSTNSNEVIRYTIDKTLNLNIAKDILTRMTN